MPRRAPTGAAPTCSRTSAWRRCDLAATGRSCPARPRDSRSQALDVPSVTRLPSLVWLLGCHRPTTGGSTAPARGPGSGEQADSRDRTVTSRIEWVRGNCRLLSAIAAEFARTRPFAGLAIGTGIHLEPKTVALLLTLAQGGARVIATGNLSSTQADTVGYLHSHGVEVIGSATTDAAVHDQDLRQVVAARPDLLLDNGGDLFAQYLATPYPGLLG